MNGLSPKNKFGGRRRLLILMDSRRIRRLSSDDAGVVATIHSATIHLRKYVTVENLGAQDWTRRPIPLVLSVREGTMLSRGVAASRLNPPEFSPTSEAQQLRSGSKGATCSANGVTVATTSDQGSRRPKEMRIASVSEREPRSVRPSGRTGRWSIPTPFY
jgi:hypothetical protein